MSEVRIRKICYNDRADKYNLLVYIWIDGKRFEIIKSNLTQKDILNTVNDFVQSHNKVTICLNGPIVTLKSETVEEYIKEYFGDSWLYKKKILPENKKIRKTFYEIMGS